MSNDSETSNDCNILSAIFGLMMMGFYLIVLGILFMNLANLYGWSLPSLLPDINWSEPAEHLWLCNNTTHMVVDLGAIESYQMTKTTLTFTPLQGRPSVWALSDTDIVLMGKDKPVHLYDGSWGWS